MSDTSKELDYTASSRLRNRVNRNHLEIWPSFPVENTNSLARGCRPSKSDFVVQSVTVYTNISGRENSES